MKSIWSTVIVRSYDVCNTKSRISNLHLWIAMIWNIQLFFTSVDNALTIILKWISCSKGNWNAPLVLCLSLGLKQMNQNVLQVSIKIKFWNTSRHQSRKFCNMTIKFLYYYYSLARSTIISTFLFTKINMLSILTILYHQANVVVLSCITN